VGRRGHATIPVVEEPRQPSASGRILALDVGRRRIGLAISDALGMTAQGLPTFERTNIRGDMARFRELVRKWEPRLLLVGLPLHMSGAEGRQAGYVREFAERVSRESGVPVELWDERLTTVEAHRVLKESGISIEKRARAVDRLAATILLESYLDAQTQGARTEPE
jgi:putative holliday junction resolvase